LAQRPGGDKVTRRGTEKPGEEAGERALEKTRTRLASTRGKEGKEVVGKEGEVA